MIHDLITEIIYEHYDNIIDIIDNYPPLINELDSKCGLATHHNILPLTISPLHACNQNHTPNFAESITRLLLER